MVGCATTKTSDLVYGQKCRTPSTFTKIKTTDIKIDTLETKISYELTPKKVFSGIETVKLRDMTLTLSLVNKAYFEEYSTPVIDLIRVVHYEDHPYRAIFGTIFLAGLLWVVEPDYSDFAFGCTNKTLLSKEPDTTKKVRTGKSEWRDIESTQRFLVSGFNKDYVFDVYMGSYERLPLNNQALINLSTAIINTDLTNSTTIKITCLDCDLLGQEEQALYKDAKKTVEITSDFRAIKADLIVETAKKKVAQVKQDKEAAIQRVVQAKEDLQRKKEAQGVPLNEFKAQCQSLGFKLGSADYGNCVLELNEAK